MPSSQPVGTGIQPATAADDAAASQEAFSFGVIGDIPYGAAEIAKFPARIQDINADSALKFVTHVGDIICTFGEPDGRAEIIAGRGAFIESYPLFGHNTADYDGLFDEKLRMLPELRDNAVLDWTGNLTQSIHGHGHRAPLRAGQAPRLSGSAGSRSSTATAGARHVLPALPGLLRAERAASRGPFPALHFL